MIQIKSPLRPTIPDSTTTAFEAEPTTQTNTILVRSPAFRHAFVTTEPTTIRLSPASRSILVNVSLDESLPPLNTHPLNTVGESFTYLYMNDQFRSRLIALTSFFSLLLLLPLSIRAQTNFTLLKSLDLDAAVSFSQLRWGSDNTLYGTTVVGGVSNAGTIFKINPDGSGFSILKSFLRSDGNQPYDGLVLGRDGALYGTTYLGGSANLGTVFRFVTNGSYTVLHSFLGAADGKNPMAALIQGNDGMLYGTTSDGNTSTRGTIFRVNTNGDNYSIIHTFTGNPDGQQCKSKLLEGSDGMLYGTTTFGGTGILGTIFKLNKDGSAYTILYNFSNASGDACSPISGLMEASDSALYGASYDGGSSHQGTIYTLHKDGSSYAVLYRFSSTGNGAKLPNTELIEAPDGMLYGAAEQGGGSGNNGALFKISKDGSNYTQLHNYSNSDGSSPRAALLLAPNGILYGTTAYGGDAGGGTIFALSTNPLPSRISAYKFSGNSNYLQFTASSAIQYDLQRSDNLTNWTTLTTFTTPPNGRFNYTNQTAIPTPSFYRLLQH